MKDFSINRSAATVKTPEIPAPRLVKGRGFEKIRDEKKDEGIWALLFVFCHCEFSFYINYSKFVRFVLFTGIGPVTHILMFLFPPSARISCNFARYPEAGKTVVVPLAAGPLFTIRVLWPDIVEADRRADGQRIRKSPWDGRRAENSSEQIFIFPSPVHTPRASISPSAPTKTPGTRKALLSEFFL